MMVRFFFFLIDVLLTILEFPIIEVNSIKWDIGSKHGSKVLNLVLEYE
jgi:hypothetical protein